MYEKAAFVFWLTLALYLITLLTVSYVGVYLTYIAIPLIALSGLIMLIAKPKAESKKKQETVRRVAREGLTAVNGFLEDLNGGLEQLNHSLEKRNRIHDQKQNKIAQIRIRRHKLMKELNQLYLDELESDTRQQSEKKQEMIKILQTKMVECEEEVKKLVLG